MQLFHFIVQLWMHLCLCCNLYYLLVCLHAFFLCVFLFVLFRYIPIDIFTSMTSSRRWPYLVLSCVEIFLFALLANSFTSIYGHLLGMTFLHIHIYICMYAKQFLLYLPILIDIFRWQWVSEFCFCNWILNYNFHMFLLIL